MHGEESKRTMSSHWLEIVSFAKANTYDIELHTLVCLAFSTALFYFRENRKENSRKLNRNHFQTTMTLMC